jgi:1-phosphofructokinase
MVVTVTLNPCIDQRINIPTFTHGGMNRVTTTRRDIAGKGINVSVALNNLGVPCLCTGINFNENGSLLTRFLDEKNIHHDFVMAEGSIRTNIKLCEADTFVMTEINQSGAPVPQTVTDLLIKKIVELYKNENDILILSGSRPQGVDTGIYKRLTGLWKGKAIVDADGEALTESLYSKEKKPFCIKPNLFELENAFSVKLNNKNEIVHFCRGLGIPLVCCSMGGDGAMLVTQNEAFFAPALNIPIRGLPGAGDAMVAGLVYGLTQQEKSLATLLTYAMAAASASVIREGTLMCSKEGFKEMVGMVKATSLFDNIL